MKIGFRTPSIAKSLKARTTARVQRSLKRSINPIYGKRGVGLLTNPRKSLRNRVYKRVSFSLWDLFKGFK